ncbi:hypothetical protein OAH18_01245 [bacterium]|nr:hypothetical protein [bacterium]
MRSLSGAISPRLLSQWADITQVAMKKGLIDKSPQAYFTYYVNKKATPHDWWHELKKKERQQEADQQRAKSDLNVSASGNDDFERYIRTEAKDAFEKVMQSMLSNLTRDGMSQPQAERFAKEQTEQHFRNKFRRQSNGSRTTSR